MCRIFHSFGHELSTTYGGTSTNVLVHMKIKTKKPTFGYIFPNMVQIA